MKVLITGGCGFLGSNLAAEFIKKNHQIFIIDSLVREGSLDNLNWLYSLAKKDQITFLKADICNQEVIFKFFKKFSQFDFICHVAGQVAMTKSIINPRKDFETNIFGKKNIVSNLQNFFTNIYGKKITKIIDNFCKKMTGLRLMDLDHRSNEFLFFNRLLLYNTSKSLNLKKGIIKIPDATIK